MKEAVIRMETAARPTTDRSASPRLLKGLLLAITLVALLATTVILCQQDIENPSYVYMILDETGMQIIDGRPDGDRTTGLLDIRADNSSRDAQLLLVKGQQVQVADAQGATYLVTTRRETVDNLLRRSDVTVGDGEMVVVDTTGETPTVSVMAEYSQTRDVTVTTPYKTERVVNHMLAKGTEEVVQEGVPGTVIETYKDTYRDGKLVSTELVSTTEDNAVTEIVEYGTMVSSVERSDYMVDVTTFDDGTRLSAVCLRRHHGLLLRVRLLRIHRLLHPRLDGLRAAHRLRQHRRGHLGVPLRHTVLYSDQRRLSGVRHGCGLRYRQCHQGNKAGSVV